MVIDSFQLQAGKKKLAPKKKQKKKKPYLWLTHRNKRGRLCSPSGVFLSKGRDDLVVHLLTLCAMWTTSVESMNLYILNREKKKILEPENAMQ